MNNNIKILLLDSNSLINRAFHALPPLVTGDGLFTNAIFGYMNMLQKLITEENPTHICAIFDCRAKTFRHKMYDKYKATRKPMPEELAMQVPVLQDLLKKLGISILFKEGYEADDIIGTLAKRFNYPTIIVSGDRDCLQLVDSTTTVYNTKRGITEVKKYTPTTLLEEGFTPQGIIEFKSLAGDSSDNIIGCPGVGAKTAMTLLEKYTDIEGIYSNIESISGKLKEKLLENKELVYLSKQLATINIEADITCKLEDLEYKYYTSEEAIDLMKYLQFKNLIEKFNFKNNKDFISEIKSNTAKEIENSHIKFIDAEKIEITTLDDLQEFINLIPINEKIYIEWKEVEIIISYSNKSAIVKSSNNLLDEGLSYADAISIISILYSDKYNNIFFDAKNMFHLLNNLGITITEPYNDVLLMGYLLNNTKIIKNIDQLLQEYCIESNDTGVAILYLYSILENKINDKKLKELYYNIELPLIEVLYSMEKSGFKIDINILNELNEKYQKEINLLIDKIYILAGEPFNINSTKQMAVVLFEKLGLKPLKKNKTGYSVNAETLEELEHPIINEILRYRELTKLKSTYIDGMLSVMNPITGKVHTKFNQCVTATGRLSSTEPNLQNIPIRKEDGREIRKMFIPANGHKLVTADYSQIELRLLAHYSGEEKLIRAYNSDGDIHSLTASKIFNTPIELITNQMRSSAKAINFGIIYGISSFGLAKNAGVSRYEAKQFIDQYFETYPAVKDYMNQNVKKAHAQGYLTTLFGRIRYFPELTSPKHNIRAFGERAAMNMPLQGTASDIIKIAMLNVYKALKNSNLKAKIILQVHDELIIETPDNEVNIVKNILKENMENAVNLQVPLIVNVSSGGNWYEAK